MAKKKCCKGKCGGKPVDENPVDNIPPIPEIKPMTKTEYFLELIKKNFLP
jgi:hypothetical protein